MTAESQARIAKATKIARTLLDQAPAARWLASGVEAGTDDFWLAAAQSAGTRPASAETVALVVALIRQAAEVAA